MAIILLSRWAAKQEDVERIARTVKPLVEKHGAKFEAGPIFCGTNTGQFLVLIWYVDWERFGRTMYAITKDVEFQHALTEAHRVGELQSRSIIVTTDLSCPSLGNANLGSMSLTADG